MTDAASLLPLVEALSAATAQVRKQRAQSKAVKRLTPTVRAGFRVQRAAVLKALAAYRDRWPITPVDDGTLSEAEGDDIDPMTQALVRALVSSGSTLQEAVQIVAGQTFVDAGKLAATVLDFTPADAWSIEHPAAVEYVNFAGAQAITQINDTTRREIQKIIEEAVADGWDYNTTAGTIRSYFDGFSGAKPQKHIVDRASLVAITEVGNAYTHGARALVDEMAFAGIVIEKRWVTTGDERVSEGCRENARDGWIAYDEAHSSGDQMPLRFPGCRCDEQYRRKRDTTD